jgi:sugar phosphate isomerase/epimerase
MGGRVLGVGYSIRSEDDFDFRKLIAALHEAEGAGVDFVELPLYALDVIAGGRIIAPKLQAVKEITADRPYRYTAHGPLAINLMDAPSRLPLHKTVLKASLEAAAELGAAHYIHHGGIVDTRHSPNVENLYAQQRHALAEAGDIAATLGLIITVENLFTHDAGKLTAPPSRLAQEIAAINHPNVRACLDFSHGWINSTATGLDFSAEARALAPFAKHLHVHDSFGQPQSIQTYARAEKLAFGVGDLHLPIGLGAIPWDEMMRLPLPDGVIINLELSPPYWSQLGECITALRRLQQVAENPA